MSQAISKERPTRPTLKPATDIIEMADGFHIFMDLPGVAMEDVSIDLNENELQISARTRDKAAADDAARAARHLHMEFGPADYRRAFTLSDTVDRDKIEATLKDGVLQLHLPKSERAKPRKIEIAQG